MTTDRYLVFAGDTYYPLGGGEDFKSSYATFDDAKQAAANKCASGNDWAHVFDMEKRQVCFFVNAGSQ